MVRKLLFILVFLCLGIFACGKTDDPTDVNISGDTEELLVILLR